jgi:hypothetical protein
MDEKVHKRVGDGDNEYDQLVQLITEANILWTYTLNQSGYNGDALKGTILNKKKVKIIMEENTEERRKVLMTATTHSDKFSKTGGIHLTSDDIFISSEMSLRGKEKAKLVAEKTRHQKKMAIEEKAKQILNAKRGNDSGKFNASELNTLLGWYNIPKLKDMSKEEKLEKWLEICKDQKQPPMYEKWTDEDENALKEASREDIDTGDTALGRLEAQRKKEFRLISKKFTQTEWAKMNDGREADSATPNEEDHMEGSV